MLSIERIKKDHDLLKSIDFARRLVMVKNQAVVIKDKNKPILVITVRGDIEEIPPITITAKLPEVAAEKLIRDLDGVDLRKLRTSLRSRVQAARIFS